MRKVTLSIKEELYNQVQEHKEHINISAITAEALNLVIKTIKEGKVPPKEKVSLRKIMNDRYTHDYLSKKERMKSLFSDRPYLT